MYWDTVLQEVLNKADPTHESSFTSVREQVRTTASMVREPGLKTLEQRRHKKYPLGENYPGVYFTEREAQTMLQLLYGKTTVEVAMVLGLSRRTIEFYIKNMKIKLSCRLKSELICKVLASQFMEIMDFA